MIVVGGVMGAGKTRIGIALAHRLGWRFVDADDLHSPASRAKMAAGIALEERDRVPWLRALAALVEDAVRGGMPLVLAASALRERHRAMLVPRDAPPGAVRLVLLDVTPALARARAEARPGHFAAASLVPSQFDVLEPPAAGEMLVVDASRSPERIVTEIVASLPAAAQGSASDP